MFNGLTPSLRGGVIFFTSGANSTAGGTNPFTGGVNSTADRVNSFTGGANSATDGVNSFTNGANSTADGTNLFAGGTNSFIKVHEPFAATDTFLKHDSPASVSLYSVSLSGGIFNRHAHGYASRAAACQPLTTNY
ncbi:MAG: hypothetical protein LBV26_09055 [Bacteroidales bacterium]|nr:hypothetical protein [Bacteroidales bacterium]